MGKFIEEFYYGLSFRLAASSRSRTFKSNVSVDAYEYFFTENLSGESKSKFLDFVNSCGIVNGEYNIDSFIMEIPPWR